MFNTKSNIWKDPDAWKDWRQEEKGTTDDEMVGWHHWLNGHESEQALGVGDGRGGLTCCGPWGHKEWDTTEWLNWTEGVCILFCTQPSEIRHNQSHTLKIVIAGMPKVGRRQQLGGANVAIKTIQVHKWAHLWKRNRLTDVENRHVTAKVVGWGGRAKNGAGVSKCKPLYVGWINTKVLLYSTGNYIQHPVITHNGEEYKENVCICITESLCFTVEIKTAL